MDYSKLSKEELIKEIESLNTKENDFSNQLRTVFGDEKIVKKYGNQHLKYAAIHDLEGNYIAINPYLEAVFKKELDVSFVKNINDILTEENQNTLDSFAEELTKKGNATGILKATNIKGENIYLTYNTSIYKTKKGDYKAISTGTYITKLLKAELELNAKNKEISTSIKNYKSLIELSPNSIIVHQKGKIVYVNFEVVNLFEANLKKDLIGSEISTFVHPDNLDSSLARMEGLYNNSGESSNVEERIVTLKGNTIDVDCISWLTTYNGESAIQMILTDISEKKKSDIIETRFSKILNTMNEGIIIVDEIEKIQYVNMRFCEIVGYSESELLGKITYDLFIHPDEKKKIEDVSHQRNQNKSSNYDLKMITKDGATIWVRNSGTPYQTEDYKGSIGVVTDITETKKLKNNQDETLKNIEDVIYRLKVDKDPLDAKVIYVSNKIKNIIGFNSSELIKDSQLWVKSVHPDDIAYLTNITNKLFKVAGNGTREYRIKHKTSGEYIWLEDKISYITNEEGIVIEQFGAARNITQQKNAILELQKAHAKFKNLFDSSKDAVLIINKNKVTDCNLGASSLFDISRKELLSRGIVDVIFPVYKDKKFDDFLSKAKNGIPQQFEWLLASKNDESIKIIDVTINRLFLEDDIFLQLIIRDITEQLESKVKTETSEKSFRELFNNSSDMIFIISEDDLLIDVNNEVINQFGYSRDEICGMSTEKLSNQTNEVGYSKKAWEGNSQFFEWNAKAKNGEILPLEIKLNHAQYFGIKVLIANARDISERKKAEKALKTSETKFKTIADSAPVLIRMTDSENSSYFFSSQFINFIGQKENDITGDNWKKYIHKDEIELINNTHRLAFKKKLKFEISYRIKNKKNEYRWILETGIPHFNDDKQFQGFITASIDITGRKVVEEALKDEESLRKSNELFRDTLETINLAAVSLDSNGKIIFCNNHFAQIVESTKDKIINKNWFKLFTSKEERNKRQKTFYNSIIKEDMPSNFTSGINSFSGKNVTLSWHNIFIRDENNEIIGITSIGEDITKSTQDALIKDVYNNINNYSIQANSLDSFYKNTHKELEKLFKLPNIYVAIHNEITDKIEFSYFADENHPNKNHRNPINYKGGLSEFVIKSNKTQVLRKKDFKKIFKEKGVIPKGSISEQWIGIPLSTKQKTYGLLGVQDYHNPNAFSEDDIKILTFISNQISLVIEKIQQKELIQQSEAKFRSIFESLQDVYYKSNMDGKILVISPSIKGFSGYTPEDLIGKEISSLYVNENAIEDFNELIKTNPVLKNYETKLIKKDGSHINALANIQVIFDEEKKPIAIEGIIRDISEIKKTEEDLKLFENMIQDNWDSVIFADLSGTIKYINEATNKLYSYTGKELVGKNIDIFNSHLTHNTDEIVDSIQLNGGWVGELKQKRKNNDIFDALLSVQLIYNKKGDPIGMASHSKDITDSKKEERELIEAKNLAESSLKVKEQFLANMSHELRTPMNGIIGITELLKDTTLVEEQSEFVEIIQKSSNNLLHILNDILDLSKIEAGKIEISPVPTNLNDVLEKVSSLYEYQVRSKNLVLNYEIEAEVPAIIKIDETRLLQILSNLVSNAIKFTIAGSITIKVKLYKKGATGKFHLLFEIIDTGIGIEKSEFNKLFSYFSQIDNTVSKEYKGTGLGLAISKEFVVLMGGEVGIKSKPNIGSTFWFTIETSEDQISTEKEVRKVTNIDIGSLDILVVDDNAVNLKVAEKLIEKLGGKAQICNSGKGALKLLENNVYDIIFMDIQMPEMNGIDTLKHIKEMNISTPVIAMTAYAMKTDKERFIKIGFNDYLAKPISGEMLSNTIKKWSEYSPKDSLKEVPIKQKNQSFEKLIELGGEEFLKEILFEYKKESSQLIFNLKKHIKNKALIEVSGEFHTLKGSSSTLGILDISELCKTGEAACEKRNFKKINDIIADIEELFNKFILDYIIE